MKALSALLQAATILIVFSLGLAVRAADYPAPHEDDWIARDFHFHTGEIIPELRLHYTTIGNPLGEPVLILHGTTMSGTAMLSPIFAGELFGPGQALDASKYYIILPDSLGPRQIGQALRWATHQVSGL
jgi:homoserine O-acetyltransferase